MLGGTLDLGFSTAAQEAQAPVVVTAFREDSARLEKAIARFSARRAKDLRKIEEARARCRGLERQDSADEPSQESPRWEREWSAVEPERRSVHSEMRRLVDSWHGRMRRVIQMSSTSTLAADVKRDVAHTSLAILNRWIRLGEPQVILQELPKLPGLTTALAWTMDAAERRAFLGGVADRLAATPGTSDVDVLTEFVAWDDEFLKALPSARERLNMLTTDLVLIFTERAADGTSLSGSELYRAGRCMDRGFRAPFRDGSDQVRHLCWALRVFTIAADSDRAEQLLRIKEARDAESRGEPINHADLELNRAARELVDDLRNLDRSTSTGGQDTFRSIFRTKLAGA